MSKHKYLKYKTKYLELTKQKINQSGGSSNLNIVILHHPILKNMAMNEETKIIIDKLSEFGIVHNYRFKFTNNNFTMSDLLFENVAIDINLQFDNLDKFVIIALEHACPFGLYYSYHYPEKCQCIICYPFRFYSKGSYERRFWKLKENGGYEKIISTYDVDNYMIDINDDRLQILLNDDSDNGSTALYHVIDFNLQKQYAKIPSEFKVKTILYTRLDLDVESIIEFNYDRTNIADMKKIFNENDAMQQSMMWNFDRVKYDAFLKNKNKDGDLLKIKYLITGWDNYSEIIDEIVLFCNDNNIIKCKTNDKKIFLVRHGETDWNKLKLSQGSRNDIKLNSAGKQQAQKTGEYLETKSIDDPFDLILCSPLKRAKTTAKIIAEVIRYDVEKIIYMDELKEFDWGLTSIGKTYEELQTDSFYDDFFEWIEQNEKLDTIERIENNFSDEILAKYEIESLESVDIRINKIIDFINNCKNKKIIIVTHGGTINAFNKNVLNMQDTLRGNLSGGQNCHITYYLLNDCKYRLIMAPNTNHLK